MAKATKSASLGGKWVKGGEVKDGAKCKLVSEAMEVPSQFPGKDGASKMQWVAKVRFEGDAEPMNININRATKDGLIDAFGDDTVNWQGHTLTAHTEKVVVSGKRVTAVYLVAEGFEVAEDANGYVQIVKQGAKAADVEEVIDIDTI